jgi:hypothetical protein
MTSDDFRKSPTAAEPPARLTVFPSQRRFYFWPR